MITYKVVYETEHNSDELPSVDSMDEARTQALELMEEWETQPPSGGWTPEEWDEMIANCSAWVVEERPDGSDVEAWFPSDDELRKIGFVESAEMSPEVFSRRFE